LTKPTSQPMLDPLALYPHSASATSATHMLNEVAPGPSVVLQYGHSLQLPGPLRGLYRPFSQISNGGASQLSLLVQPWSAMQLLRPMDSSAHVVPPSGHSTHGSPTASEYHPIGHGVKGPGDTPSKPSSDTHSSMDVAALVNVVDHAGHGTHLSSGSSCAL
jgi:hypothetical protein